MKRLSLAVLLSIVVPVVAAAQTPSVLGYQGRLLLADGTPATGVVSVTFALFDSESGGVAWWNETQSLVLTSGYYATFIGGEKPLDRSLFDGRDLYLEITVEGEAMKPRQRVGSVAYAIRSGVAHSVAGGTVDASSVSVGGTTVIDGTGALVGPAAYGAGSGLEASGGTFSLLQTCAAGEILKWDGATWACATDGGAGGVVTGVTATAPLTSTGGTNPDIGLPQASSAADGFLSATDWTMFSNKLSTVSSTAPFTGAGTAVSPLSMVPATSATNGYLTSSDWGRFDGKVSTVTASAPLTSTGGANPNLSLAAASATQNGYLAGTDYAAFAAKVAAVTASGPLSSTGGTNPDVSIARSSPSQDGYLAGADFAAFDAKVSSVGAGVGTTVGGTAQSPTVNVTYGTTAGTAAQGDDVRLSDARDPRPGSGNYIQNQVTSAQTGGFNVTGDAFVGGSVGIGNTSPRAELDVTGEILGTPAVLVAGPAAHNTSTTTGYTGAVPLSFVELNTSPSTYTVNANSVTIGRSGYYEITSRLLALCPQGTWLHVRLLVNGGHAGWLGHGGLSFGGSWNERKGSRVMFLPAGSMVAFETYNSTTCSYRWHSLNSNTDYTFLRIKRLN